MRWVIDVCRTCGKIATWPFCEHRPVPPHMPARPESWCCPVAVVASPPWEPSERRESSEGSAE